MIINMNGAKAPETPSPVLQEKTVTPETLPTVIGADEGYTGLSQVTVNPDTNLKAENIRSGKTIFGVEGVFGGGSDSGLVLADIKPYARANVIINVEDDYIREIPCTVEVTSAELTSTQGYQSIDKVKIDRQHFDYDNASYDYLVQTAERVYEEVYGKITVNITIQPITWHIDVKAEKNSPVVTESRVFQRVLYISLYDAENNRVAGCYLTKNPAEIPAIFICDFKNSTTTWQNKTIFMPEITINNLEFYVASEGFDPDKALTATSGKIGPSLTVVSKVVK